MALNSWGSRYSQPEKKKPWLFRQIFFFWRFQFQFIPSLIISLISTSQSCDDRYVGCYLWFLSIRLPHFFRSVSLNIQFTSIRYVNGTRLMPFTILWHLFYAFWSVVTICDMFSNTNPVRCILFHFVVYLPFHTARNLF